MADPLRQLERVKEASFDPLRNVVAGGAIAASWISGDCVFCEQNRSLESGVNGAKFRTETSAASVMVFSQMAYPGWHATVDGRELPLIVADFAFPAVELPAGTHQVVFPSSRACSKLAQWFRFCRWW